MVLVSGWKVALKARLTLLQVTIEVRTIQVDTLLIFSSIMASDQESQLKSLLLIQSWVTKTSVVEGKIILIQAFAAASTFSDSFSSKLEMDATEVASFFLVDCESFLQLGKDVGELSGLDTGGSRSCVAMHGIALPNDSASVLAALDGLDVCR